MTDKTTAPSTAKPTSEAVKSTPNLSPLNIPKEVNLSTFENDGPSAGLAPAGEPGSGSLGFIRPEDMPASAKVTPPEKVLMGAGPIGTIVRNVEDTPPADPDLVQPNAERAKRYEGTIGGDTKED